MLLGLAFVTLNGYNQTLFLNINHAASILPDAFWQNITMIGDTLVALTLLPLIAIRHPALLRTTLLAAIITALLIHGLKPLFDVARPPAVLAHELFNIIGPAHKSDSFPSGHAATVFTLVGCISLVIKNRLLIGMFIIIAILTGLSRTAVGVHWPADIMAGAMLGWIAAIIATSICQRSNIADSHNARLIYNGLFALCAIALLLSDAEYHAASIFKNTLAVFSLAALGLGVYRLLQEKSRHSSHKL